MIHYFTWEDFDKSVEFISNKLKFKKISSIYGVPRGGLCLAVALSHKLNLKLTEKPLIGSLIVDDVYETGLTLNTFKNIKGAYFYVLFSKIKPSWWNTVNIVPKEEWVVFPWENSKKIDLERKEYNKKRGLI